MRCDSPRVAFLAWFSSKKEFLSSSKPAFFKFDKGFYVCLVSGVTERDGDERSAERFPTASGGDGSVALPCGRHGLGRALRRDAEGGSDGGRRRAHVRDGDLLAEGGRAGAPEVGGGTRPGGDGRRGDFRRVGSERRRSRAGAEG